MDAPQRDKQPPEKLKPGKVVSIKRAVLRTIRKVTPFGVAQWTEEVKK